VIIGSGETKLQLSCVARDRAGRADLLRARVTSPGLDVARDVYQYGGYEGLATLFEGMAEQWRGWDGEREYYSLEGDLEIVGTHDGHVRLALRLNQHSGPGVWTVRATAVLDPGEDLAAAATSLRGLVDGPSGLAE
jgi:hypothetical protein